ncbi:hypothetical protein BH11PSE12_BH11PSE12_20270 [soil metagenome]
MSSPSFCIGKSKENRESRFMFVIVSPEYQLTSLFQILRMALKTAGFG